MHQGEILGLRWEDVDLDEGIVRVRRTLTLARGGPRLAEPKTRGQPPSNTANQLGGRGCRAPPGAPGGRTGRLKRLLGGSGPRVHHQDRHAYPPGQAPRRILKAAAPLRRTAGYPLPRPQAHLRDAAADERRPPEDSLRDARALERIDHLGYLQPRDTGTRRRGGVGDGRPRRRLEPAVGDTFSRQSESATYEFRPVQTVLAWPFLPYQLITRAPASGLSPTVASCPGCR